jgi:hypothetical protein
MVANIFFVVGIIIVIVYSAIMTFFIKCGLVYYYKFSKIGSCFKTIKLSSIYDNINTGDIILFCACCHGFFNSLFTNTLFTHAGIVVRNSDDTLNIHELSQHGTFVMINNDEHIFVGGKITLPLLERIKYYSGTCYYVSLKNPLLNKQQTQIVDYTTNYTNDYPSFFKMILGTLGLHNNGNSRNCSQFICDILTKIGILNKKYTFLSSLSIVSNIWDYCDNYNKPMKILIDK